jgi:hypothetical protein
LDLFLSLQFLALDIVTDNVFRECELLDLEVYDCAADLNGLSDGWRELKAPTDQD